MDLAVQKKFETYPKHISVLLQRVRELILDVATENGILNIEETLKWGEPSYVSKIGSTIRFDWKEKHPDQYWLYFSCQTILVETFREIYGGTFTFDGNRAIVFNVEEELPINELSHCLSLALRYKKVKHLNLLGV